LCSFHLSLYFFLYFQLHITTFSALNNEIIELRERLQKSDLEKDELKVQVQNFYDDKVNTQRHWETITNNYDTRITEMHSIIIELNKKLKVQQDKAIIEENEGSGIKLIWVWVRIPSKYLASSQYACFFLNSFFS
jgi:hypothetical protein